MKKHEDEETTAAVAEEATEQKGRVSGSVYGPAAARIRELAKELRCSPRELVQAILVYADPAPAARKILDDRLAREKQKIQDLKDRFSS